MSKKSKKSKKQARRRQKRLLISCISVLCALALVLTVGIFASDRSDISAKPSDVIDDGIIRVNLRSLGNPAALGLTLDGVYTVDGDAGFRFKRGTEITVACDEGKLLLTAGGLTIDMGGSFTLKRHAPEEGDDAGGLYIHESEKDNLFAGDLYLSANQTGIDTVLTVQVEDYLYGVVAYEMSDSFPIEALKAQAIAARTYAMRAKQNNKGKLFDVVDTTQDQVYKGFDKGLTTVIKAVDGTRGIVGMNGTNYAQCYYTASNGGQVAATAQIWGGKVSYIEMKDDPYDLENKQSVEKKADLPKQPKESSALAGLMRTKLFSLIPDAQEIRIDSIESASLTDPDVQGSKMYRSVTFEVKASKRILEPAPTPVSTGTAQPEATPEATSEPAAAESISPEATPEATAAPATPSEATPAEATPSEATPDEAEKWILSDYIPVEEVFTVVLPTYGCLKEELGLSINSMNYEVFELTENENGWTLISRRFGHGVGMSQRGAQVMASSKYGRDCEEILGFYYPGLTLYQIDWTENTLTPLSALPDSVGYARARPTPRPTQQPLRSLKKGEYYGRIKLQSSSSSLNVRKEPNTSCAVVANLYNNERIIVLKEEADGWLKIETTEFSGYVKAEYVNKE